MNFIKKYYQGGMISLVFLPIVFTYFLNSEYSKPKYNQVWIKLNIPKPNHTSEFEFDLPSSRKFLKVCQTKHYQLDSINRYKVKDSILLSLTQMKELVKNDFFLSNLKKKTGFAVEITLSKASTYDDFVFLVNACIKLKLDEYIFDYQEDKFNIICRAEPLNSNSSACLLCNDIIEINHHEEKSMKQMIKDDYIVPLLSKAVITLLLFSSLIVLSIFSLCIKKH